MTRQLLKLRSPFLLLIAALTLFFLYCSLSIAIDAGFEKQLPRKHPFIETFRQYQEEFGGANRILIAVAPKEGTILQPKFLQALKELTDEAYYIEGVNRAQVRSIFTPNVRFVEVIDGGFAGGNVVPADFDFSEEQIEVVRQNILKSPYVGRLVAEDFTAALIALELSEIDPTTGERLDYLKVAEQLEEKLRKSYERDGISVHIIGFAKAIGDIAEGARGVLLFLGIALLLVALLLNLFTLNLLFTAVVILCSLAGVIWNVGLLSLLGFGFDPMSILVPFLVFAIGVSHAVQMVNRVNIGITRGMTVKESAHYALSSLLLPGLFALFSDTLGFATIYLIEIPIIQELAITASIGVAGLIVTNLLCVPLLLSYCSVSEQHKERCAKSEGVKEKFAHFLGKATTKPVALPILASMLLLFGAGLYFAQGLRIGDVHSGVPELRADSRYNQDSSFIVDHFSIGVDILTAIVETPPNSCIDHSIVSYIDKFQWVISNNPNVQSTLSLPQVMKRISTGWNEGHPKWWNLSRNSSVLVQAVTPIETSTGLLNAGCTVVPVTIFLKDHSAETIESVVNDVLAFAEQNQVDGVTIRLATGNAGVMAAVNETVEAAQYEILLWIYGAITLLCLLLFRSFRATIAVLLPLGVVSVVAYALMALLEIGLKLSSLPVAALGVGIGVDYGIYIFSQLARELKRGEPLTEAYTNTLRVNGGAVLATGLTLALAVSTWIFSALQFQADMGILFASMLLLNMLGALFVLPALSYLLFPGNRR